MNLKNTGCLFCNSDSKNLLKIADFSDFYVLSDGAPLSKGHLLLVTRSHIPCFASLPKEYLNEYFEIRKKIIDFLEKYYGKVIIFEHGVSGQTINHAHLHFLPTNKPVIPQIKNNFKTKKIKDFSSLQEIYNKNKKYLYIEEHGSKYDVLEDNPPPGFFHSYILADLLGVSKDFATRSKNAKKYFNKNIKLWE